ncbi:MAG: DNA methyltransferase [Candidatus Zixiibacteriota bacterium]
MSNDKPIYGPHNPHPLSNRKTELIWDGKYDEYGNRREVDIASCSMPMQKIETVDEPRSEAAALGAKQLDAFEKYLAKKHQDDFRNMMIWGDNKLVMASLLKDFKGKVDLIYIDPPFDVGADFTMEVPIGAGSDEIYKDQSTLEMVAYRDTWGRGVDSYLSMIYERLILMRDLLAENGYIVIHVGDKVAAPVKLLADDIFGDVNYRNSIIIPRGIKNVQSQFKDIRALSVGHDVLMFFSKSEKSRVRKLSLPGTDKAVGKWDTFWRGTNRPTMRYKLFGIQPNSGQWRWSRERAEQAKHNYEEYLQHHVNENSLDEYYLRQLESGVDLDFVRLGDSDTVQYFVPPRDYKLASTLWTDVRTRGTATQYATEKNEELLSVIIEWLSNDGDLVADFFCGSGTTGSVAEQLGRKWIMADLGRFAVHTSRKRLIDLQRKLHSEDRPYRAFDVYNLGRYERQWWQHERLKGADQEHRRVVLEFFKSEILNQSPSPLLHGRKAGSFCHVDGIDSIFTREEAREVAIAVAAANGREVYCLAWEFEMDLRQTCLALEAELGVKVKLIPIPREIMEKNRKEPPPFLEMAVLGAKPVYGKNDQGLRTVDIKLEKFIPSLAEVPSKELEALKERAIKSGIDFVDFWAIDFEWEPGKPFRHHWQDYRTRKDRKLLTVSEAKHVYPKPGKYTACVKVVDTFGCDTSITVEVEI